jgi:hypothetical protein
MLSAPPRLLNRDHGFRHLKWPLKAEDRGREAGKLAKNYAAYSVARGVDNANIIWPTRHEVSA